MGRLIAFTPVQTAVLPLLLKDKTHSLYSSHGQFGDICISAPTGSGKTLAYVIPIVEVKKKKSVSIFFFLCVLSEIIRLFVDSFDACSLSIAGANCSSNARFGRAGEREL